MFAQTAANFDGLSAWRGRPLATVVANLMRLVFSRYDEANPNEGERTTVREAEVIIPEIFGVSPAIRYVAVLRNGQLHSQQRSDLIGASASESDKYEELFVNPALLKLVQQRGNLDCGGAKFVLVRYGNFYQFVYGVGTDHVSICFELSVNPLDFAERIEELCGV
jgi:hypothetical protein